ncbi:MAG: ATP-dependent RNA helicase HrpA [Planctomycetes bacterium]|nr:ATP-dependent RNA helicase HrpA [Planctomycetota bacterium]
MTASAEIEQALARTLLIDRHRLRRQWRGIQEALRAGRPHDQHLVKFRTALDRSCQLREQRWTARPIPKYDDLLPVCQRRDEIAAAIRDHRVVVLCGETGSGKSTQLPKICLELGRGVDGLIGHTQPRRIAARSVATRIAEELNVSIGREVGFKVRFADSTSAQTYIKLMTDGILLAETQHDHWLDQYDTIIVDEAHERSLNIDFLLGYLHRLVGQRRELKVIITSATIDAQRFADHFQTVAGHVPVLEVSGRTYPVEILYQPLELDDDGNEPDLQQAVANAISELTSYGPGDVLVFMPTEREIHEASKTLRGRTFGGSKPDLLPLYARLSAAEQQRVFQMSSSRRIIIATNVAESSLTVPGIRYVVDTGTARISRYSPKTKLQRLPIEAISRASADQRAGRCGRIGPGICIRLYSEDDYAQRERFTAPEILRSNLADVILQTKTLGLGPIEEFPFLEPPKPEAVRDGYKTLFELGAVTETHELTPLGRKLSRLPVDPRIARIVWAAIEENCLGEILIIASALEIQDPRERPLEKQQQADEAHARFADEESDFISYLKMWDFYHKLKSELSHSQLRKACLQNFLSWTRLREWIDVHAELVTIVTDCLGEVARAANAHKKPAEQKSTGRTQPARSRLAANTPTSAELIGPWVRRGDFGAIHRALLTGFLSSIAVRTETGEYQTAGSQKAYLWPGSGTLGKKPKWIVAAELVETTRRFLRTVARIDPNWIEPLAGHLLSRSYSEPHWDAENLGVAAFEKVSLFGLLIVPRRRVGYGRIDPVKTRELFLQHGLVFGEWGTGDDTQAPKLARPEFLVRNQELIHQLEELQTRSRRGSILKDEEVQYEFYDTRLPADIMDGHRLVQWLRTASVEDRHRLLMSESDLVEEEAARATKTEFPDVVQMQDLSLPLSYRLDPGADDDGVTVTVPQEGLNQLDSQRLGWLVPGLIQDKIEALIRTLPKESRRTLVPIPETAARVADVIRFGDGGFADAVATGIEVVTGVSVPRGDFQEDRLPYHLRMQIRITDSQGKTLAAGRDLTTLRQEFGAVAASSFSSVDDPRWNRDQILTWDFSTLPPEVEVRRGGIPLKGYPTLIDQNDSVSLRLVDAQLRANYELRFGVRRLICLTIPRELKQQIEFLPQLNNWTLQSKTFPQPLPFRQHLTELVAERAFLADQPLPRSEPQFRECLRTGRLKLAAATAEVAHVIGPLFQTFLEIRKTWEKTASTQWQPTRQDIHAQLGQLFASGFLVRTPWPWLQQFPRYARAIVMRLQKLSGGSGQRDLQNMALVAPRWQRGIERLKQHRDRHVYDPELEAYRWMTEEFRVSLFAQELGTAVAVSEKRLDQQWLKVSE